MKFVSIYQSALKCNLFAFMGEEKAGCARAKFSDCAD
jgi:hypothetical protein